MSFGITFSWIGSQFSFIYQDYLTLSCVCKSRISRVFYGHNFGNPELSKDASLLWNILELLNPIFTETL